MRASSVTYRPEIDGLRALAIIPVVLFHARVAGFGGGFVGVDVFFVVSGFLITSLIKQEIDAGVFSYLAFWERRARRLLPPMILVVAVTSIVAYGCFFPGELKPLGQSVVAISVFASNMYFWLKSNYFEAPAEMIPLLHTWTLAVEEQFYMLFPVVLVGLTAWRRMPRIAGVVAIGVVSFALSVWWVQASPSAAYYLLPSRAWELMLGAGLALSTSKPSLSRLTTDVLLLVGLALIAAAVRLYRETTPFPGLAALVPCAGTALVIWAGDQKQSLVKHVLDNRFMVFVGKLSYSIYLWHWPLLVIYGAWYAKSLKALTVREVILIVAVTVLLSWLSLAFVENPIRRKTVLASRRAIFTATGTAMAGLAAFGFAAHFSGGFESRVPADVAPIVNSIHDWEPKADQCGDRPPERLKTEPLCQLGENRHHLGEPRFLLWGDSHAQALLPAVDQAAKDFGVLGVHASHGGCPPLAGVYVVGSEWHLGCQPFNEDVFERIAQAHFDVVFLAANWSAYPREGNLRLVDRGRDQDSGTILHEQLLETIRRLTANGTTVFIVEEVPYPNDYHPSRVARAVLLGADPGSAGISVADYRKRNERFTRFLDGLNVPRLKRVSPMADLCHNGIFCPALIDGRSNYIDAVHLSTLGASQMEPSFRAAFEQVEWK